MKTRRAKPGSPFRQERYCSSPEYERGLMANLVAMRCRVLDSAEHRELVWFFQWLSHQPGGIAKAVEEIVDLWPERFSSRIAEKVRAKGGKMRTAEVAETLKEITSTTGDGLEGFLAKHSLLKCVRSHLYSLMLPEIEISEFDPRYGEDDTLRAAEQEIEKGVAPDLIRQLFRAGALGQIEDVGGLEDLLSKRFCLDPAFFPDQWNVWYVDDLQRTLFDYKRHYETQHSARLVTTEIGRQVNEALDYSLESRDLVLIEGLERRGKTHATKAWCDARPGLVRYISVPSSSDDIGFFRAIGRGLGLSLANSVKAVQLRDNIQESVQDQDLMLVFDNAHFLFPQTNYREAIPQRVTWILTSLVDEGVPVAFVTTPQFTLTQQMTAEKSRWRDAQLTGRIMHFARLPQELSEDDLRAVARVYLPQADEKSLKLLIRYAEGSDKYLQGIESLAKRAMHLAKRAGRETPSFDDLKEAMVNGVIPSDTAMVAAIESAKDHLHGPRPGRRSKRRAAPLADLEQESLAPVAVNLRGIRPAEHLTVMT